MARKDVIQDYFNFLDNYNFVLRWKKTETGSEVLLENEDKVKIIIMDSSDYRDEDSISLLIKRGTKMLFTFNGAPIINANLVGVEKMVSSLHRVYDEANMSFRGFTEKHYEKVISIYADFTRTNINEILPPLIQNK